MQEREGLADLKCACATARRLARTLTQLYDGHLRQSGIEVPQFGMLSMLSARPGCSQAAIGRALTLEKTTLSRNLKVLRDKGWIEPARADDGRERGFVLTRTGEARLKAAQPQWKRAQARLRASLKPEDWDSMWAMLRTVTEAARAAEIA